MTKEARVLQIKGNTTFGVQPVFSVPASFPLSPSSPLLSFWPHQPLALICLCVVCPGVKVRYWLRTCRMVRNTEQTLTWDSWQTGNCYARFKKHGRPVCCREDGRWNNMFLFPMKLLNSLCEIFWYTCVSMRSSRRKVMCLSRFAKITSKWKSDLLKEINKYIAITLNNCFRL